MKKPTKSKAAPAPAKPAPAASKLAPKFAGAPRLVTPAAPAPKPARAPAKAGARKSPGKIVVNAMVDVGFGNTLYIRGEGADLDWNKGKKLGNVGAEHWTILFDEVVGPVTFKFLLNDETWCSGENYTAHPGTHGNYTPLF